MREVRTNVRFSMQVCRLVRLSVSALALSFSRRIQGMQTTVVTVSPCSPYHSVHVSALSQIRL